MPENIRFRFGRIDLPSAARPTVQEVRDEVENLDNKYKTREEKKVIEDEDPIPFKHKGANAEVRTLSDGTEYCYYTYFSDTEESALIRDGDNGEEEDVRLAVIIVRVLYLENGQFAYETSNKLHRIWIPEFIDMITGYELSGSTEFEHLLQETVTRFYNSKDRISRIRFSTGRDDGSNAEPDSQSFIEQMKTLMKQTGSQTYTKNGRSLNEVSQVQQLAEDNRINIDEVVGKDEAGVNEEIYADGSTLLGWHIPEWDDHDESGRKELIESELGTYFQELNRE